jgi:hypothetical protein
MYNTTNSRLECTNQYYFHNSRITTNIENNYQRRNRRHISSSSSSQSKITSSIQRILPIVLLLSLITISLRIHLVHCSFIDIDTPLDKRTTTSFVDGTEYHLVS